MDNMKEKKDLFDLDFILLFAVFPPIVILFFSFIFWQKGWGVLENFVIPIAINISEMWKEQGLTCIVFYSSLIGVVCTLGDKVKISIVFFKRKFLIIVMLFLYELLFYPCLRFPVDATNQNTISTVVAWISMIIGVSGSAWFLASIPQTLFMLLDSSLKNSD